ncbi:DNA/RNA-binding protein KIN17 [Vespula maculifrons]|uniref:DNA/RNA-binding protein KIN17 n=1 Tax=Vespula maculifrons TaxID=7453 RepID=A0ABD2CSM2_VESMC
MPLSSDQQEISVKDEKEETTKKPLIRLDNIKLKPKPKPVPVIGLSISRQNEISIECSFFTEEAQKI